MVTSVTVFVFACGWLTQLVLFRTVEVRVNNQNKKLEISLQEPGEFITPWFVVWVKNTTLGLWLSSLHETLTLVILCIRTAVPILLGKTYLINFKEVIKTSGGYFGRLLWKSFTRYWHWVRTTLFVTFVFHFTR